MHKDKAFLYVCAGLFLLALSYHLGARSAAAQIGDQIQVGGVGYFAGHNTYSAAVGRTLYRLEGSAGVPIPEPIPGTSPIVAVNSVNPGVLLANGDIYEWGGDGPGWFLLANMLGGGPVPARAESFGALKSRYRGASGAPQPAPLPR